MEETHIKLKALGGTTDCNEFERDFTFKLLIQSTTFDQ